MEQTLRTPRRAPRGIAATLGAIARSSPSIGRVARSAAFDADWYQARNPEPIPAWLKPSWHYACFGRHLDPSPYFDTAWYTAQRPDAAPPRTVPLAHYLRYAEQDPHPHFSNWWYLRRYADARDSGLAPLEHYLRIGLAEGRDAKPPARSPRFRGGFATSVPLGEPARLASAGAMAPRLRAQRLLCVFSHYHPNGRMLPWLRTYLAAIQRCGFDVHVVSTAPHLNAGERAAVEAMGIKVHQRENRGHDFGSWQWAFRNAIPLGEVDWLLLANDSVFGPLFELEPIVQAQLATGADFWGITDSYQLAWHLQSYFLCFRGEVARSAAFRACFAQDFASKSKWGIINDGEVFLSQSLIEAGYRASVVCPYDALDAINPIGVFNPTHHQWELLITRLKSPFIKRDLILRNPEGVKGAADWQRIVARHTRADISMIAEGLQSLSRWALLRERWF